MSKRRIEYVPLVDLPEAEVNPKGHDDGLIDASFDRFGYMEPVLLDERTGRLIGGHGRKRRLEARRDAGQDAPDGIEVRKRDGMWLVPVVRGWASLNDDEALAALVVLNQSTVAGGWQRDVLGTVLDDLRSRDVPLEGTGFSPSDLDEMLAELAANTEPIIDATVDPNDVPDGGPDIISTTGDVWELGDHLVRCGATGDDATLAWLLECPQATMVWTDPPYGVEYTGRTADALTIQNDGEEGLPELLAAMTATITAVAAPGAAVYVAAPPGRQGIEFALALRDAGMFRQRLVWVKNMMAAGWSDYRWRHEDIYFGYVPGAGRRGRGSEGWYGGNAESTVLEFPKPRANREHPTMKPVELIQRCIANSSRPGEVVLDLFGGSGSTLIAAHKMNRRAVLVEMDPKYVDVICRRWQTITGVVPVNRRTGEPVDFLVD